MVVGFWVQRIWIGQRIKEIVKSASGFEAAKTVVDSTAAGDSFNAAYLAARLSGGAEADCLSAGHTLATRVIGVRGAIMPGKSKASA